MSLSLLLTNHNFHFLAVARKHWQISIKEVELRIPLVDSLALIPDSHKFLKDLIVERIHEVQGMVVLSHEIQCYEREEEHSKEA